MDFNKKLSKAKKQLNKTKNKAISSFKKNKTFKSAKKNLKSKKSMTIIGLIIVLIIIAVGFNLKTTFSNPDVVAKVNDEEITSKELENQYNFFFFLTGYPESYRQIITKESYLDQLINEEILLQEAEKKGIKISDQEVESRLSQSLSQSTLTKSEFELQLNNAGLTMKNLVDYYKKQMTISQFLNSTLSDIEINDSKIKAYYENNIDEFTAGQDQIRARHILVETEEKAKEIKNQIKQGKSFVTLAEKNSIGPTAVNGGDLGIISKGQMVPEFEKAAFNLNPNQISDVIETQFGYHIIKREPDKISLEQAEESIIQILRTQKQKQKTNELIEELKKEYQIIKNIGNQQSSVTAATSKNTCYGSQGLTSDTIIFYHAEWCPHCTKMRSVVKELEQQGYNFHWAETSSGEGTDVIDKCFKDVLQGGVPQFICAGNKEYELGEMSKSKLKKFAENCQ